MGVLGQQHEEYAQYAKYAGRAKKGGGGGGILTIAMSALGGSVLGYIWTGRKMTRQHSEEKKELLKYIQSIDDVYKKREAQWQAEYTKLYKAYEEIEKETLERDYEEFKAPDSDGDDLISRAEFDIYVRKYLSSFPELSEKDFPKFDEFDLDGDGIVSFEEWQRFLQQQKLAEATKGKKKNANQIEDDSYAELLQALYEQSAGSDSFKTLDKRIDGNTKGRQQRRA